MKERPILFSASMVRAILNGSKTQTRRVIKQQPPNWSWHSVESVAKVYGLTQRIGSKNYWIKPCPYGQPGDRLWCRETWADLRGAGFDRPFAYLADSSKKGYEDEESKRCRLDYGVKWRPSIHMPRIASRITLEITGVRVERLHDITNNDALDEGTPDLRTIENGWDMRRCFQDLWEQINGAGSWAENPWVWVIEFKKV